MAFTMALNALEKGHDAMVLLMVEAVELGQPDATDGIDVGQRLVADYLTAIRQIPDARTAVSCGRHSVIGAVVPASPCISVWSRAAWRSALLA